MESLTPSGLKLNTDALNRDTSEENNGPDPENFELEMAVHDFRSDYPLDSMTTLEILRETVRILRFNSSGFMAILALLICPVSAVFLSSVLVDKNLVKRLSLRLLLVAKSSGLPLMPFDKQLSKKISEAVVSVTMCFPLFTTLLLLAKAAVAHSVDYTYSKKKFDVLKFYDVILKIWKRILFTYLWACLAISGCMFLFLVFIAITGSIVLHMGFQSNMILYPAGVVALIFSVILANAMIICHMAVVVSVLEDVSGPEALLRSSSFIRGQTQVGLSLFLVSAGGMAFVEGLFDHRVKTVSYGDGSSRIWEGPLLVLMYSFIVLIDSMASAVFYFSCKSYHSESAEEERQQVLVSSTNPADVQ